MGCGCGKRKNKLARSQGIKSARSRKPKTITSPRVQSLRSGSNKCPKCNAPMRIVRNGRTSAVTAKVCSNASCRHRASS